ncbi:lytic transglycosylase domain-containing protein [Caproiciproducens sp. MSJ-32]|uniref:lytic transglycosylase domain-containing protein n=1 Tax=Caproiciproducens sp. MSJ-32 TaxID=2841527 RepID=UPI002ED43B4E
MKIQSVEKYLGSVMTNKVLKEALGDGYEFELVYESLINSDSYKDMLTEAESEQTYTPVSSGQKLEDIPLRYRQAPIVTGELYLDDINKITSSIDINKESPLSDVSYISEGSYNMDTIFKAVDKYASKYGVDRNLILAIIKQESNFNPNATSHAGAKGLMQLMDFNSEAYGVTNPYDIEQNIEAGVRHIKSYLNMYNGNLEMALMAYNGGPGTMERRGVKSSGDLYKMPQETQNYVPKVLAYYNQYKNS